MTITRTVNGEKFTFELTQRELRAAWYEEQQNCDESDILWAIEDYTDEEIIDSYGVTKAQFEALVPQMAHRLRKYQDNDDSFPELRDWAICDTIYEFYPQERKDEST